MQGIGEEAGVALVAHPDVKVVSFTGSSETGREVAKFYAEHYKKVALEMGGKNPIVVMDDADLELALEGAVWGAFGTTGQRCTATSRLIVHRAVRREFTDRFVERAQQLRLGDGLLQTTDVGPLINEAQLRRVHSYTEIARQEGAKILTGGYIYTEATAPRASSMRRRSSPRSPPTCALPRRRSSGHVQRLWRWEGSRRRSTSPTRPPTACLSDLHA